MKKLRIYTVSAMAMRYRIDAPEDGGIRDSTYVEHLPHLIPAESIGDAAEQVRRHSLERWNPDNEWYGHQALIQPVTKDFFEKAIGALEAGSIAVDDEAPQAFVLSEFGVEPWSEETRDSNG